MWNWLQDRRAQSGPAAGVEPGLEPWVASPLRKWVARIWPPLHFALGLAGLYYLQGVYHRSQFRTVALVVGPWRIPLYYPWLLFLLGLCAVVVAMRLVGLVGLMRARAARPARAGEGEALEPSGRSGRFARSGGWLLGTAEAGLPTRLRLIDLVLLLLTAAASWWVLEAFRLKENPQGAMAGMDAPTFLLSIVAAGLERWGLYNPDKRLGYSWASVLVSGLKGMTFLEAAQWVSFWSAVLVSPVTYLMALPVTGRVTALCAALFVVAVPTFHNYAIQTSSYAFYYLVTGVTLAAAAWAVSTRRVWLYALLGFFSAVGLMTDIKGLTVLVPVLGAAALFALQGGLRGTLVRVVAMGAPLLLYLVLSSHLPVHYTRLSWLVSNHRAEVHQEMGYRWPSVKTPDPMMPSPISSWLPAWLRDGEIEALAAVILSPPDSDVVIMRAQGAGDQLRFEPEIRRDTSIPPLRRRLEVNLHALTNLFSSTYPMLVLLMGIGLVAVVVPLPRRLPPTRHLAGLTLLGATLSVWGSLSLKFHIRYLLHVLPVASMLLSHGAQTVAQQVVGPVPRVWRAVTAGLVAWFVGSIGLSVMTEQTQLWLRPGVSLEVVAQSLGRRDAEAKAPLGAALTRVAEWLTGAPADAAIYDCSAMPVWLMNPGDPRYRIPPEGDSQRFRLCQQVLSQPTAPATTFIVASFVREYSTPDTPSPAQLLQKPDRWALVFGVGPAVPLQEFTTLEGLKTVHDAVLVFRGRDGEAPASP